MTGPENTRNRLAAESTLNLLRQICNLIPEHFVPPFELTQIKRHRGSETEGRRKGSLTHGKKTPAMGVNEHEQRTEKGWLPKLQERYARRNREGKSRMLDELCEDYEYERKYAIKLLGARFACRCRAGAILGRSGGMKGLSRWCGKYG